MTRKTDRICIVETGRGARKSIVDAEGEGELMVRAGRRASERRKASCRSRREKKAWCRVNEGKRRNKSRR